MPIEAGHTPHLHLLTQDTEPGEQLDQDAQQALDTLQLMYLFAFKMGIPLKDDLFAEDAGSPNSTPITTE